MWLNNLIITVMKACNYIFMYLNVRVCTVKRQKAPKYVCLRFFMVVTVVLFVHFGFLSGNLLL